VEDVHKKILVSKRNIILFIFFYTLSSCNSSTQIDISSQRLDYQIKYYHSSKKIFYKHLGWENWYEVPLTPKLAEYYYKEIRSLSNDLEAYNFYLFQNAVRESNIDPNAPVVIKGSIAERKLFKIVNDFNRITGLY